MLLVQLIATMFLQTPATPANADNRPILVEETGVATVYEATKNISCGDVEWRVGWNSSGRGRIRGDVTVLIAGKGGALPEAQAQVFDRFRTIDGVSATCNKGAGGRPTRSSLLVSGYGEADHKKAMAQLNVGPDHKASWSFNTVD